MNYDIFNNESIKRYSLPVVGGIIGGFLGGPVGSYFGAGITNMVVLGVVKGGSLVASAGLTGYLGKKITDTFILKIDTIVNKFNYTQNSEKILEMDARFKFLINSYPEFDLIFNYLYWTLHSKTAQHQLYSNLIKLVILEDKKLENFKTVIKIVFEVLKEIYIINSEENQKLIDNGDIDVSGGFATYHSELIIKHKLRKQKIIKFHNNEEIKYIKRSPTIYLYLTIERLMFLDLYPHIFEEIKASNNGRDTDIFNSFVTINEIMKNDPTQIELLDCIHPCYTQLDKIKLTDMFNSFYISMTPFDKICCLIEINNYISTVFKEMTGHSVGHDDLLPLFSYCVILVNIPNMYSQFVFLDNFFNRKAYSGRYDFMFVSFASCIQICEDIIKDHKLANLDEDTEEGTEEETEEETEGEAGEKTAEEIII
jgi:hypothetical protein